MRQIKGFYDEKNIKLLEREELQNPCHLIVAFIEDDMDIEKLRQYPADEDAFEFWKAEEEDLYQDYCK